MDETVSRLFYYLLQNAAWVFIYVVAFKKANKLKFFQKMVHIIALTCTQEICRLAVGPVIVQLLMLAVFYTFVRIEAPKASKQLLTEVTFTYALRELFRLFCSLMSTFLCMLLFETKSWTAIVSIHSMLMIVICGLYFLLFRQGKLLKLGEKYSIGIFATIFILMLAALGKMQAPYSAVSREYFLFIFFTLAVCFILLVLWARNEYRSTEEKERLDQALQETQRERDDLWKENHRLGKTLPELEREYRALEEKVKAMRDLAWAQEFSRELDERRQSFSAAREQLLGQTQRVDTDSGAPLLNSAIAYTRENAARTGVLFGCRILTKADRLLASPGATELDLQQIMRNLLDNAVHAAVQSGREPRMVQCVMGMAGAHYQIDVYDSGDPFPPKVLERLGELGNTTDGNGVGLADVLETLARCDASIFIVHFDVPKSTGATKRVTVCFDGKAMAHLPAAQTGEETELSISALLRQNRYKGKREDKTCTR